MIFPPILFGAFPSCLSEAMLQPNGLVGIWDTAAAAMGAPCEVPGQAGPIARCYFSSGASLLWGQKMRRNFVI